MNTDKHTIDSFVDGRNSSKLLFTAGPASLLAENISGLRPCFGRGDADYDEVEASVSEALKCMTGLPYLVRMQGSATLALEIMCLNFLYGRILVVSTGYYSDRLRNLAQCAMEGRKEVKVLDYVSYDQLSSVSGQYDWILSCYTETSCGMKIPIEELGDLARRLGGKLMLDATASVGLEGNHSIAHVIGYSSCKGLFGLTGAAFISSNVLPTVEVSSFYLSYSTHAEKLITGPYHAICSLRDVLSHHSDYKTSVENNKRAFMHRMEKYLSVPLKNQPLLCTRVTCNVTSADSRAVLYKPRSILSGSVVCHLGEAHLKNEARGEILNSITVR